MRKPIDDRAIETHHIIWSGVVCRVSFVRNWMYTSAFPRAHLQLESISPARAPLPMTETGYRSHFTSAEEIDAAGGPVAYALAWLEDAAKSPAWSKTRQLDLFG